METKMTQAARQAVMTASRRLDSEEQVSKFMAHSRMMVPFTRRAESSLPARGAGKDHFSSGTGSARLVKRALPSPVPIVSTPQCSTSRMNGTSLSPCTTASLCMTINVS